MNNKILGQTKNLEMIKHAGRANLSALLIGETGTGKTSMVEQVATEQGKDYIRFNLTGETTVEDFVGKFTLEGNQTVWNDGVLLQAMKSGAWLIVDEINAALPEILFTLHSLLDHDRQVIVANHEGEIIKAAPGFRFFATMNPVANYAGTKELNRAFLSRFDMVIQVKYPDSATELRIIADRCPDLPEMDALKLVNLARLAREKHDAGDLFYTCSTRDVLSCAQLAVDLAKNPSEENPTARACEYAIINKVNPDEQPELLKIIDQIDADFRPAGKKTKKIELTPSYLAAEYEKLKKAKAEFAQEKKTLKEKILKELAAQIK